MGFLRVQALFYPDAYPDCSAVGAGTSLPDFTQLSPMLSRCQDSLDIQVRLCKRSVGFITCISLLNLVMALLRSNLDLLQLAHVHL